MAIPIRSLRPDYLVYDLGDARWRGGQVWSIDGETVTIRCHVEQSYVRNVTCDLSLVPAGAQSIGSPVCCRLTGSDPDAQTIVEIVETSFLPGSAPRDNAASVAAGIYSPGIVPRSITNEPVS